MLRLLTILLSLLSHVQCRDSSATRLSRFQAASNADLHIAHSTHTFLPILLQNSTSIIFYGAEWCKYTQLFTPEFLKVQERVMDGLAGVNLRKVECSVDEVFCTDVQGVAGYPTVLLYKNGFKVEEYLGEDNEEPFYQYVMGVVDRTRYETEAYHASMPVELTAHVVDRSHAHVSDYSFARLAVVALTFASLCAIYLTFIRVRRGHVVGYESVYSKV